MRSKSPGGGFTRIALGAVALGALLTAAGPRYPVALAPDGAPVGPAFGVWPLLAVLAVVPAVVSVMLVLVRQRAPALALVASVGTVTAGRLARDVQLLVDPVRAARAELVAPDGFGPLTPGLGAWMLLAGQALTVLGGLAAARAASVARGERSMAEPRVGATTPPAAALLGVGCAVLVALGMLTPPYASDDPWLVPRSVLDAPRWSAVGGFALAVGVLLAVALACSAPDPRVAVGGLVGTGIGVLGVVAPQLVVAGLAGPLRVTPGPVLATVGTLGLGVLARGLGRRGGLARVHDPARVSVGHPAWAGSGRRVPSPRPPEVGFVPAPRTVRFSDLGEVAGGLGEVEGGLGEVAGGLGEVAAGPYPLPNGRGQAGGVPRDVSRPVPPRRIPADGVGGAVLAPRESPEMAKPGAAVVGGLARAVPPPVRPAADDGPRGLVAASVGVSNKPRTMPRRPVHMAPLRSELFGRPAAVLARRWRLVGAWLAVLAGGCAAGSGLTEPLRLAADLPHPQLPTRWLPVVAGAVLVVLGLVTTTRPLGSALRPVLAVALVTVPMVAGEPLGELLDVLGLDGVAAGPALGLLLAAVALVVASAVCLVLAGGFDRDDADLTPTPYEGPLAAAGAASAVLTVPAFWLPLLDGAGWGVTGVLQAPLGLGSWGLLAAFTVIAGALLVVPRCRTPRALALLGGTVVVLTCRLVRPVLTPGRLPDGGLGAGFWAGTLCLLAVLVTAVLTVRVRPAPVLSSVQEACAAREQEEVWR